MLSKALMAYHPLGKRGSHPLGTRGSHPLGTRGSHPLGTHGSHPLGTRSFTYMVHHRILLVRFFI